MALPTKITLEIVTPDRSLVTAQVDELQLPGSEGYFGVLPGHTPMLATLKIGEMWYRIGQEMHYLAIAFGFVEVLPERVTVLAQIAERAEEIDVARASRSSARFFAASARETSMSSGRSASWASTVTRSGSTSTNPKAMAM